MKKYKEITKDYDNKNLADKDSLEMKKQGFRWFSGWYTLKGFSVEYRKY